MANEVGFQLLITIPGVGQFTALLVRAEVGTIKRFPDEDHLASYCGFVPSVHSSGNHTRKGHITKEGNKWLRWALVEATWKVKNRSKHFRKFYTISMLANSRRIPRPVVGDECESL